MKNPELTTWTTTLGWTLLHSVWQSTIIGLLYLIVSKLFSPAKAAQRYVLSTAALFLILATSIATFIYLQSTDSKTDTVPIATTETDFNAVVIKVPEGSTAVLLKAATTIEAYLFPAMIIWITGVALFSLRLGVAWFYSVRLRSNAEQITEFWDEQVKRLADQLAISGKIILAQSGSVRSPIVLGFFKPIILLPIGMLSGLSSDQIESILLHELAHIRRHDYLINILQSITEVVFFFNPLVWIISSHMRTEREQCCDDIVIKFKNPLAYARALHLLEEERVWSSSVGIAAAGNKNQLLTRIKRIMETTEKKEQSSRKIIPALLIVAALIGASWLSVEARRPDKSNKEVTDSDTIESDTSIKEKKKNKSSASYSRKTVITRNDKDTTHEEISEEFSFDPLEPLPPSSLTPLIEIDAPLASLAPDMVDAVPPLTAFQFSMDTIPDVMFYRSNEKDLEEFNRLFTEEFKSKFGDFYKNNEKELTQMMKDLNSKMENIKFSADEMSDFKVNMDRSFGKARSYALRAEEQSKRNSELGERMHELAERQREIAERMREITENKRADRNDEETERHLERDRDQADRNPTYAGKQFSENAEDEARIGSILNKTNPFNKTLKEELVKDKYLADGEEINELQWNDETIEINGKAVSQKDAVKYNRLLKDYLKSRKKGKAE